MAKLHIDNRGRVLRLVYRGLTRSRYQDNRGNNIIIRNDQLKHIHNYGSTR